METGRIHRRRSTADEREDARGREAEVMLMWSPLIRVDGNGWVSWAWTDENDVDGQMHVERTEADVDGASSRANYGDD
jgi:hypothetical protein